MMNISEKQSVFLEDMSDAIMKKYSYELISYDGRHAGFMIDTGNENTGYIYISVRFTGVIWIHIVEYEFDQQEEREICKSNEFEDIDLMWDEEEKHIFIMIFEEDSDVELYMKKLEQIIDGIKLITGNYGKRIGIPK